GGRAPGPGGGGRGPAAPGRCPRAAGCPGTPGPIPPAAPSSRSLHLAGHDLPDTIRWWAVITTRLGWHHGSGTTGRVRVLNRARPITVIPVMESTHVVV